MRYKGRRGKDPIPFHGLQMLNETEINPSIFQPFQHSFIMLAYLAPRDRSTTYPVIERAGQLTSGPFPSLPPSVSPASLQLLHPSDSTNKQQQPWSRWWAWFTASVAVNAEMLYPTQSIDCISLSNDFLNGRGSSISVTLLGYCPCPPTWEIAV
ncbi:uncharacterized protein BO97DRAFT_193523 [Aspergillus homomorphus CBS 101889]|uniref:Uncharacterized protein n=1 Tax=Aspergillus homomorphus (strain CBS 101889) TaxID=1450537 RepID=A0A395HM24_ASPHC|nr:hypothetical protein BO97DRAFT_193523 [Aspergillus homomorphus CBS 101889]RAL08897.1 hypothetical protein BO97DRAFT_193523 [Aspergillus homomorphus CBS 101889]